MHIAVYSKIINGLYDATRNHSELVTMAIHIYTSIMLYVAVLRTFGIFIVLLLCIAILRLTVAYLN